MAQINHTKILLSHPVVHCIIHNSFYSKIENKMQKKKKQNTTKHCMTKGFIEQTAFDREIASKF